VSEFVFIGWEALHHCFWPCPRTLRSQSSWDSPCSVHSTVCSTNAF